MSDTDDGSPSRALARRRAGAVSVVESQADDTGAIVDWSQLQNWARRRQVVLGGLVLIAAQLAWKGFFLTHFFFRQDDFHYLDRALDSGFSWRYLSYVGSGHLQPGTFAITWVLARLSLYNWALATAVSLVLLAAASLAALLLLRRLFGDHPVVLVPLAIYLLTPLTLPDLGYWSSATESLPLQVATFMALYAHVRYVRERRAWSLVAAAAWLVAGLIFFEKAVVLPLLLFAVTSGFCVPGSWPRAMRRSLVQYWRAWLVYAVLALGYLGLLAVALRGSTIQPGRPTSLDATAAFAGHLLRDTFLPGALGGPWQWLTSVDGSYAYSAPPAGLAWLAVLVAVALIGASIWARRRAWRAWAILAGWLVVADMLPVLLGRIEEINAGLLGIESRYVADAAPVLAICVGLAFLPVAGQPEPKPRPVTAGTGQLARAVAAGTVGAFVIGSIWSAQAYVNSTSSLPARTYIGHARIALRLAPPGTTVVDQKVSSRLILGLFGVYADASKIVGEMHRTESAASLRWLTKPSGTLDNLMIFGVDGRLHRVRIVGQHSPPLAFGLKCWPQHGSRVVVPFAAPSAADTVTVRIGYLYAPPSGQVTVSYGNTTQQLAVQHGLHSAYLPVQGSAGQVVLSGLGKGQICVGDAEAGTYASLLSGPAIPPVGR
jgi:hypothetical protein